MRRASSLADPELEAVLQRGGAAVLLTDTIYGLVAKAMDEQAVANVYRIKGRSESKAPIVLIASFDQLISPAPSEYGEFLKAVWPGPNSVIIPTPEAPSWLSRGKGTVAYRLPDAPLLTNLISRVGPLIAPSANPEGAPPATSISQAMGYFGEAVDIYVDGSEDVGSTPSALYKLDEKGRPERLR